MTNNPTKRQEAGNMEELRESIIAATSVKVAESKFGDIHKRLSSSQIDAIMELLTSEVEKAKLEGISLCQLKITQMLDPSGDTNRELILVSVLEELSKLQEEQK